MESKHQAISRREMIAATCATVATGAIASSAHASEKDASSADSSSRNAANTGDSKTDEIPDSWDYECDYLIIGYGGAGQWSALCAADECGAKVLCLEKAPERGGGNSSINLGEFTYIEEDGIDQAVEYVLAMSQGLTPEPVVRAWAKECTRNFEYAERWGLSPYLKNGTMASGGMNSCEFPTLPGSEVFQIGALADCSADAFDILDAKCADLGVEILFSCHDEKLIQDPQTKEILGCWTYIGDDPEPKAVKGKRATLLSTGGFEFNEEMKNEYLKVTPMKFCSWPFNTGDGQKMAQQVGAQLWHMNMVLGEPIVYFPNDPNWNGALIGAGPRSNDYIIVNRFGKRWWDESSVWSHHNGWKLMTTFDFTIADYDRVPSYYIVDSKGFEAGPFYSGYGEGAMGIVNMGMSADCLPDSCGKHPGWSSDNVAEKESGLIPWGNTVEELVEKLHEIDDRCGGMDPAVLQETIDAYNSYCETGEDLEFGRNKSTMSALVPPYYALPIYPGSYGTLGGCKKNEYSQVLDVNDEPIPRLYTAGSNGNMAMHAYGISGGNNAENLVWGRIAARNGCALDPWDE
jgi:hypothetical protein